MSQGQVDLVASVEKLNATFLNDLTLVEKANGHKVIYITESSPNGRLRILPPL